MFYMEEYYQILVFHGFFIIRIRDRHGAHLEILSPVMLR